jgi:Flp pilus assembly pilin Flp
VKAVLRSFIDDDSAQDLVEYAYLTLIVGLAGILVWSAIVGVMSSAYSDYDSGTQGLWEPPDPPPPP